MQRRDLIRGYATALFEVAEAEGALERLSDELYRFATALERHHDLRAALTDPVVDPERKERILDELLGERVSLHTRNVLKFVVGQGRARELAEIVRSLAELAAQARGRALAEVRSAVPLDEEQRQRLAGALSVATGRAVEVKVVVDPSVVGGVYAKVGDQVIDGTVRRRLEELRERLEAGV